MITFCLDTFFQPVLQLGVAICLSCSGWNVCELEHAVSSSKLEEAAVASHPSASSHWRVGTANTLWKVAVFVKVLQRNRTNRIYREKEIYYKESVHMIMVAEKSEICGWQSGDLESQWCSSCPSPRPKTGGDRCSSSKTGRKNSFFLTLLFWIGYRLDMTDPLEEGNVL